MATYTPPTISNYNDNPPSNDGSENFSDNGVDWDLHINEIGDPIKNYIDAVNNEADSGFDVIDASRPISVLDYGAVGDGSTDDSAAIQSAIDFLEANGGGALYFPNKRFKCNINVEASNIQFVGEAFTPADTTTSLTLVANTVADPVLRLGDGTNVVNGFTCSNMTFNGEEGTSAKGIFIQGAHRCSFHNISSSGFSTYCVQITSTATRPTSHIYWSGFYFGTSADATSVALDLVAGGSYVTAVFFSNGNIASNSSAKWTIQNDDVGAYLTNTWCTCNDGKGVNILNGGKLYCNNVTFDSTSSTDVLVVVDHNNFIQTSIRGVVNIDGLVKFADATTASLAGQGNLLVRKTMHYDAFIMNALSFSNTSLDNNAEHVYTDVARIYNQGDVLILESTAGNVKALPSTGVFEINGPSADIRLVDTTASVDVHIRTGAGDPNGSVTGALGDLYLNASGGANVSMYIKESGTDTNTGWVAK